MLSPQLCVSIFYKLLFPLFPLYGKLVIKFRYEGRMVNGISRFNWCQLYWERLID